MTEIRRIALVTDFGAAGPYMGQMRLVLEALVPGMPVLELVSDLPPFRPDLAAYLLPALRRDVARGTLYLCVVDPGVGGERAAVALEVDGDWLVAPDNGLLALVARGVAAARALRVDWRPARLSESFHGRDLFAPIAARLAAGDIPPSAPLAPTDLVGADWADSLARILYTDRYGNLITGLRASDLGTGTTIRAGGRALGFARTFCEVTPGTAFWFEDSFGLVEIAVNQGSAGRVLGLEAGDTVEVIG
jgi:S-adenosylmethionine hydrolase